MTHTKTTGDWSELKRLAEAAESPSPWHESEGWYVLDTFDRPIWNDDGICGRHDAAFIAAANPATVLELIAENEQKATELYEFKLLITGGEDAPGHAGTLTVSEAEALLRGRHRQSVEEAVALKAEIAALKAQRDEMAEALRLRDTRFKEILDWVREENQMGTAYECDCGWSSYHRFNIECENCGREFPFLDKLCFKLGANVPDEDSPYRARTALNKEKTDG